MAKSTSTNNLVTKKYLKEYMDDRFDQFGKKLKEELYQIKDEIVGEIKASRDESYAHQM